MRICPVGCEKVEHWGLIKQNMKTRFELSESFDYYEDFLKKHGFLIDANSGRVFKEYDSIIILNERDEIQMDGVGVRIIEHKKYDVDKDMMVYRLVDSKYYYKKTNGNR